VDYELVLITSFLNLKYIQNIYLARAIFN